MRFIDVKVIDKPWGREIIIGVEDEYAGKIIEVTKGHRLSYQYHERKKETMHVYAGEMKLIHEDGEIVMKPGDSITLHPGDKHRIEALTDVKVIEVSTSHLDDVVRIEDDYGRIEKDEVIE
ncbi:MAG: cupin domain-containing protein [Candidatus Altiarchaeota archaeon]